jgi:carboxypeptidase C (cathepsin A)
VSATKKLHYWFYEAEENPQDAPLTFWSNGGPGCSGLLGAMTEQGPFRPNKDLNIDLNPYAWNKVSNMVFIEAPCGVGFSYSTEGEKSDDYTTGDDQTATDNYAMIQGFLTRFPEYSKNELYITSESYGGHYMPTLAKKIVDENTAATNPNINFKGFAVGNPYTNFYTGTPSGLATYWGHQLVAKPTWDKYEANCKTSSPSDKEGFQQCEMLMAEMFKQVTQYVNPYALDYPICNADIRAGRGRAQRRFMTSFLLAEHSDELRALVGLNKPHAKLGEDAYEPCEDDYTQDYLNRADVKEALHVQGDIKWEECSYTVHYSLKDKESDMTGYYNYLIDGDFGLNILVYSGDDDSVCATEGTQSWIWDLGYKPTSRRGIWETYLVNDQLGGYYTEFEGNLGFLTVHGAGHEVPTYQPEVALDLFTKYLNGEWFNRG